MVMSLDDGFVVLVKTLVHFEQDKVFLVNLCGGVYFVMENLFFSSIFSSVNSHSK